MGDFGWVGLYYLDTYYYLPEKTRVLLPRRLLLPRHLLLPKGFFQEKIHGIGPLRQWQWKCHRHWIKCCLLWRRGNRRRGAWRRCWSCLATNRAGSWHAKRDRIVQLEMCSSGGTKGCVQEDGLAAAAGGFWPHLLFSHFKAFFEGLFCVYNATKLFSFFFFLTQKRLL